MAKHAAKSGSPRPPSVERVLAVARERVDGAIEPRVLSDAAREVVDGERARLGAGEAPRDVTTLGAAVEDLLRSREQGWREGLVPVINATGVIVHTNLGRAPWPEEAGAIAIQAARTYLLLELDRDTGRRGQRYRAAEEALVQLTGAEDALVTNNNAAAVALAVGLAGRGGVAVSRGELVEIGGGVRIPEIVRRAGARLVEVGTTNRTRAADFEEPLAEGRARLVLRVHPSNFTQSGFVEMPDAREVAALAHRHGAIVVDDLGSGALLDTARFGLTHEPMPGERLADGSDVVTFSGDKLVGGPQAGLVVGRADLVARMRKDPLARAMRPDKATLAAVAATLGLYRAGRAETHDPRLADDRHAVGYAPRASRGARRRPRRCRRGVGHGRRSSLDRRWRVASRGDAAVVGRGTRGAVARSGGGGPAAWLAVRAGPCRGRPGRPRSPHGAGGPAGPAARGDRRGAGSGSRTVTVVVGTAGHIDHGKTTLLRALTGIDADRLPEERRRGMTIDVGYAHLALPDGTELDFVDVPGHDRLVGNMLVGAGEIDAALLVVAADDGLRAQTHEHIDLLDALDVRHALVAITKADLVDRERTGEVCEAVAARLASTALAGAQIIVVSGTTGEGIEDLRAGLVGLRDRVMADPGWAALTARPVRLAVDRAFRIKGRGTVVTGTLRGGPLARGANLSTVPGDAAVRVREVQVHGAPVEEVAGGGRTALNLAGDAAAGLQRGVVLTSDPDVHATNRCARHARGPGSGPDALPDPPRNRRGRGRRWSEWSRRRRAADGRRGRRAAP